MPLEAVSALYRAASAVAEHHDEATIVNLHVATPVDAALAAAAQEARVVFVTGNPGDGKTHLIRKVGAEFPSDVEVCLDANTLETAVVAGKVSAALAGGRRLVLAINEGILVDLTQAAAAEPWAGIVRRQLLHPLIYDEPEPHAEMPIVVLDLSHRNVLDPAVVLPALERVLDLVGDQDLEVEDPVAARNVQALREPQVRDRLAALLEVAGRSGVHGTMRDLLGYLAYLISGPSSDGSQAAPYYVNAFEGGAGPLFDAVRRFDPLRRPMPLLDDALWRVRDDAEDWVLQLSGIRRRGEEEQSFPARKRRAYFEHRRGMGDLERAGGETDQQFRDLLNPRGPSVRNLVKNLNRFHDRRDTADDTLHLWLTHRYDARASRYAASRWSVSVRHLQIIQPRLPEALQAAFPGFQPDHVILRHADQAPREGLIVDRRLLDTLASARLGMAAARNGEPAARISAFFDRLARIALRDWQSARGTPQVTLLDMERARRVVVGVDLETRSYVRP